MKRPTDANDDRGLNINYIVRGEGRPVLLLHGWGACIGSFAPVTEEPAHHRKVYVLDFRAFGESDTPAEPMTVADYARLYGKVHRGGGHSRYRCDLP